jgi:hypothetical protein
MKYGMSLFVISVLISIVILSPTVKKKTLQLLMNTDKTVLSQLEMERQGVLYKVIKVQNIKGLAVEVYKVENEMMLFLDAVQLSDKQDAFYKFGDKKYNLFLKDLNDDGEEEIILPSLDKNMKARLNVFSFDSISEVLRKQTAH